MKSIQEIKEELKRAPEEELPALCALYQEDGRKGVREGETRRVAEHTRAALRLPCVLSGEAPDHDQAAAPGGR